MVDSEVTRIAPGSAVFRIELVARPGVDGIRALRALLKIALRTFQLRCIEAREIKE
jgi:hypothetical protein